MKMHAVQSVAESNVRLPQPRIMAAFYRSVSCGCVRPPVRARTTLRSLSNEDFCYYESGKYDNCAELEELHGCDVDTLAVKRVEPQERCE